MQRNILKDFFQIVFISIIVTRHVLFITHNKQKNSR